MGLADTLETRHKDANGTETAAAESGAGRPQGVNLAALPQLKGSVKKSSSPKWGAAEPGKPASNGHTSSTPASPAISRLSTPQGSVKQPSANKSSQITVQLDIPSDDQAVSQAVKQVSTKHHVRIEMARLPAAGKASFIIKGTAVDAAKRSLEAALGPRTTTSVLIPSAARSALLGARGANLRGLEREFDVSIDLSNVDSSWSLSHTKVTVEGPPEGVKGCLAAVKDVVNFNKRVSSQRRLTPQLQTLITASDEFGPFVAAGHIAFEGNAGEVAAQMQKVDRLIDDWHKNYETLELPMTPKVPIPSDLVLSEYGVAVLPDNKLYGPPKALPKALEAVKQFLARQTTSTLDIAQAHNRELAHARLLSRYFAATHLLERLAAEHAITISGPETTDSAVTYTFAGSEEGTSRARKALVREVKRLTPQAVAVVRGMRFPLVRRRAEQAAANITGPVTALLGPSDELFLVYTEPDDDFLEESSDVQQSMDAALAHLSSVAELAKHVTKRQLKIGDAQVLKSLQGPVAQQKFAEAFKDVDFELVEDGVVLHGLKPDIERAAAALPAIIHAAKQYALRASHVEEFNVDANIVGNLIGRQGQQIQAWRSEFDVKLEIDESGHVRIQGVEEATRACAREILDIQRRLRDELTENLAIPSEYHAKLIGSAGKHVKRLRDQHNCVIRFPRPDDEDQNVIFVRGPSRGVNAIKKEFMDLVNFEKAQSYTETIAVKRSAVPRIVGRGGMHINAIRNETKTNIDIGDAPSNAASNAPSNAASNAASNASSTAPSASPEPRTDGDEKDAEVDIVVVGERKNVQQAIAKIREAAQQALDTTEITLNVAPELHRLLTGTARRELVAAAGGDAEQAQRYLSVNGSTVRLLGPSAVVAKLESKVNELLELSRQRSGAAGTVEVPGDRLRFVLGAGGSKREELEKKFDAFVNVPRNAGANKSVPIAVQAASEKRVGEAIAAIRKLTLPVDITVGVSAAAWSPRLRSGVQSRFGVRLNLLSTETLTQVVDEPTKPADSEFITKTVTAQAAVQICGETREACDNAAKYLAEHATANTYGFLWVPVAKHRSVIGQGGKTISRVRADSKATVEVPSPSRKDAPIVIIGNVQQVEKAKELILEAAK